MSRKANAPGQTVSSGPDPDFFDLGQWPVVLIRFPELHESNRVERLLGGLDQILDRDRSFVAVWTPPGHDHSDEPHEDEKAAVLWIKKNRERLNRLCQGYIYVTRDTALRSLLEERLKTVSGTLYQFPMQVVSNHREASLLARQLLGL